MDGQAPHAFLAWHLAFLLPAGESKPAGKIRHGRNDLNFISWAPGKVRKPLKDKDTEQRPHAIGKQARERQNAQLILLTSGNDFSSPEW